MYEVKPLEDMLSLGFWIELRSLRVCYLLKVKCSTNLPMSSVFVFGGATLEMTIMFCFQLICRISDMRMIF